MDSLVPGMAGSLDEGQHRTAPPTYGQGEPPRGERLRSAVAVLASLAILAGLLTAAYQGGRGALARLHPAASSAPDYPGPGTGNVVVEVRQGETPREIGKRLAGSSIVASPQAFVNAATAKLEQAARIQPGFYRLRTKMSAAQALGALLDPAARAERRVTLPEGLRLEETLQTLAKGTGIPLAEFEAASQSKGIGLPSYARKPEGFLFPATYDVPPNASATSMLKLTTARFDQAAREARLQEPSKYGPYDVVTVASLVEGEARRPEDYAKVARVIYNRLRLGRPLELDSTVNYVLRTAKQAPSTRDIAVDSPYNTYRNPGLPPGPISSPGEQALDAAKHPARGPWLYFVTTDPKSGATKFTASYQQFLAFKREYQRAAAAGTG